ncbi:MAG: BNR-4 repeat-containing protein, partial [Candidatus Omnitrophica bacterium]|nr:BNR-4 repeat-containing protein [Candidatus Omnitrophota bacterium]
MPFPENSSLGWLLEPKPAEAANALEYHSHLIQDAWPPSAQGYYANGEHRLNAGERTEIYVYLKNTLAVTATSVTATLSTLDSCATTLDNSATFPDISADEVRKSTSPFIVEITPSCLVGHLITFDLSISSTQGSWNATFDVEVLDPEVKVNTDLRIDAAPVVKTSSLPQICSDNNGHVYSVWRDSRNSSANQDIYFNYSNDFGSTWQPSDIKINKNAGLANAWAPKISCDQNGNVYVVWFDNRAGSNNNIYLNYSRDYGKTWQPADRNVDLDPAASLNSLSPQISSDSSGHVYVTWREFISSKSNVYFNRSSDYGATWPGPKIELDTNSTAGRHSTNPKISSDSSGNVYVTWEDNRSSTSNYDIYFIRSINYGASWLANIRLDTNAAGAANSKSPEISNDSAGHVYIAWYDYRNSSTRPDIYFTYSGNAGATWASFDKILESDVGIDVSFLPVITADENGNVYVAWYETVSGATTDYNVMFRKGNSFGASWPASEIKIDRNTSLVDGNNDSYNPVIKCDNNGHVYAAWRDNRNGSSETIDDIFLNYSVDFGSTWQAADEKLDTSSTDSGAPQIISDIYGHVYAVWDDNRANPSWDIYFDKVNLSLPTIEPPGVADQTATEGIVLNFSFQASNPLKEDLGMLYDISELTAQEQLHFTNGGAALTSSYDAFTGMNNATFTWTPPAGSAGLFYPVAFVAKSPTATESDYKIISIDVLGFQTTIWNPTSGISWGTAVNWTNGLPDINKAAVFDGSISSSNCDIDAGIDAKGIITRNVYSGTIRHVTAATVTVGDAGFNQNGGSFLHPIGSGDMVVNGNFALKSGTFQAPPFVRSLKIAKNFEHSGGVFNHNSSAGGVELISNNPASLVSNPAGTVFYILRSLVPSKEITFRQGDTFTVQTALHLNGGATGTEIKLLSSGGAGGAANRWNLVVNAPTANSTVKFVEVQASNASAGNPILAEHSINQTPADNLNWIFEPSDYTWTGSAGTGTWEDTAKWNNGTVQKYPDDANDKAIFNAGSDNVTNVLPVTVGEINMAAGFNGTVTLGDALLLANSGSRTGSLTVAAGTLNLNGKNLTVSGAFTNNAAFKLFGSEVLSKFPANGPLATVTYQGGTGTYTKLAAGNNYSFLTFSDADTTWQLDAPVFVTKDLSLSSGTLDTSTSNHAIDVTGNMNIAGKLKANGSAITIAGSLTVSNVANKFIADTSTVKLTGSGNLSNPYYNSGLPTQGNAFYNLWLGASGQTTTLTDTINITNVMHIGTGQVLGQGLGQIINKYGPAGTTIEFEDCAQSNIFSNIRLFVKTSQNIPTSNAYPELQLESNANTYGLVNPTGSVSCQNVSISRGFKMRGGSFNQNGYNLIVDGGNIEAGSGNDNQTGNWYTQGGNITLNGGYQFMLNNGFGSTTGYTFTFDAGSTGNLNTFDASPSQLIFSGNVLAAHLFNTGSTTFKAQDSFITVKGHWYNTNDNFIGSDLFTFIAGTSTLTFASSIPGVTPTQIWTWSGGLPFNNLVLSEDLAATDPLYRISGTSLTVNGDFSMLGSSSFDYLASFGGMLFRKNFEIAGANNFNTNGRAITFSPLAAGTFNLNTGGKDFGTSLVTFPTTGATHKLISNALHSDWITLNRGALDLNGTGLLVDVNLDMINNATLRLHGDETPFAIAMVGTNQGTVEYAEPNAITLNGLLFSGPYFNLTINAGNALTTWNLTGMLTVQNNFTLTQGTLNAGANTMNFGTVNPGVVTLTSGTLNLGSGTHSVKGPWTKNGTTIIPGSSTVTFNAANGSTIAINPGSVNGDFNNVTFTNAGGAQTVYPLAANPSQLTVKGNLTIGGTSQLQNTSAFINVYGNWTNTAGNTGFNDTAVAQGVVFRGTNQTISGSTTFMNFTMLDDNNNNLNSTLTFSAAASDTQTFTANLQLLGGDDNDKIQIRSTTAGTAAKIKSDLLHNIRYVDVQDSNACPETSGTCTGKLLKPSNSSRTGTNTSNWDFGKTISGNAYDVTGAAVPVGTIVEMRVNGGSPYSTTTAVGGAWSMPYIQTTAGDTITIYTVSANSSYRGNVVTISDGNSANSITGIVLYGARVTVRSDYFTSPIRIADMVDYDSTQDPVNMLFDATLGTPNSLTIPSALPSRTLFIPAGEQFAPEGTVSLAGGIQIEGTLAMDVSDFAAGGDWNVQPTGVVTGNNTVTLTGTSQIRTNNQGFFNLVFSGSSFTLNDNLNVNGSFTILNGQVLAQDKTITVGQDLTIADTPNLFNAGTSTVVLTDSGNLSNPNVSNAFYNLWITPLIATTVRTLSSNLLVTNALRFGAGTTQGQGLATEIRFTGTDLQFSDPNNATAMRDLTLVLETGFAIPRSSGYAHLKLVDEGTFTVSPFISGLFDITCNQGFTMSAKLFDQDNNNLNVLGGDILAGGAGISPRTWRLNSGNISVSGNFKMDNNSLQKFVLTSFATGFTGITVSGDILTTFAGQGASIPELLMAGNALANFINLSGNWMNKNNAFVFTAGASTVRMQKAIAGTSTIETSGYPFYNLTLTELGNVNPTYQFTGDAGDPLVMVNEFKIESGASFVANPLAQITFAGNFNASGAANLDTLGQDLNFDAGATPLISIDTGGKDFGTSLAKFNSTGSTVYQLMNNTFHTDNIEISNSALQLNGNALTVDNTLTISTGGKLQLHGDETVTVGAVAPGMGLVEFSGGTGIIPVNNINMPLYNVTFDDGDSTWDMGIDLNVSNNFILQNGILNLGLKSLNIDGDFTLNAGTIDLGSANHHFAGNWSNAGAFVTAGASMVTFDASAGIKTITTFGKSFNNLTLDNSATYQPVDALDINGNLVIQGTAVLNNATGQSITVAGNWTNNAGAAGFVDTTGKVILNATDGLTQGLFGDTTFNHLEKTNYGTLTFQAGSTQRITGLVGLLLQGTDTDNMLTLASTSPGTQWFIDIDGGVQLQYVNVSDGNATNQTYSPANPVQVYDGSNAGGNTAFAFGGVLSGTLKTITGTNVSGARVIARVNGGGPLPDSIGALTDASGNWSIDNVNVPLSGGTITVYTNTNVKSNAVMVSSGSADISVVNLIENRILLRSETVSPVTNTNLDKYDGNLNPTRMLFTVTDVGGVLYMETNVASKLYIDSGDVFKPIGVISNLYHIETDGTLDMTGSTNTNVPVRGDWLVNGTGNYIHSNGKIIMRNDSVAKTLTNGTGIYDFYDLEIQSAAGTGVFRLESDLNVEHDLLFTSGMLNTRNAAGTQDFNLSIPNRSLSLVTGGGKLTANSSTITVGSNFTVDNSAGLFDKGTSTVDLTGTGNLSSPANDFYGLKIAASAKTTTLTSAINTYGPLEFKGGVANGFLTLTHWGEPMTVLAGSDLKGLFLTVANGQTIPPSPNYGLLTLNAPLADPFSAGGNITCSMGFTLKTSLFNQQGFALSGGGGGISAGSSGVSEWNTGGGNISSSSLAIGPETRFTATGSGQIQPGNLAFSAPSVGAFFKAGSSTIKIVTGWDNTSVFPFNAENSTVEFQPVGLNQPIASGGLPFFNVKVSQLLAGNSFTLQDDLDVNGNLDLTGSTLNANDKTIRLAGQWNNTAGNFTAGTGIVIFDGTADQTVRSNGKHFYDVEINKASGLVTLQDDFFADQNLTVAQGTFYSAGKNITVSGAISLPDDALSKLRLHGNEMASIVTKDTDSGIVEYGGSATAISTLSYGNTYWHLVFNQAGSTWNIPFGITAGGNFTVENGTVDLGTFTHTIKGNWARNGGGIIPGVSKVSFAAFSGTPTIKSGANDFYDISFGSSALSYQLLDSLAIEHNLTVLNPVALDTNNFDLKFNTENQANVDAPGQNFDNVIVDKLTNGVLTIGGANLNMSGVLSIASGTLDVNGKTLTAASLNNSGVIKRKGAGADTINLPQDTDSGTWLYVGDGSGTLTISDWSPTGADYFNLEIDLTSGTDTISAAFDLNTAGTLYLKNGTLNAPAGVLTLSGNFSHSGGNFNHNGGTVTLAGGAEQTLTSLAGITFENLICDNSLSVSPKTIRFGENQTFTMAGLFKMKGAGGSEISLLSSGAGGTSWTVVLNGSRDVGFVKIQDSTADGLPALLPVNPSNSVDLGNNWLWFTGTLNSSSVLPASLTAGATGSIHVGFVTHNILPKNGKVIVTLPGNGTTSGFVLPISTSISNVVSISSTISTAIAGQQIIISLAGNGLDTPPSSAVSFDLSGVTNPQVTEATGLFSIQTQTSTNQPIDENLAVSSVVIEPAAAGNFILNHAPMSLPAGQASTLTVTVNDIYGNLAYNYTGQVTITSSDPQATLPAPYPFSSGVGGDNGVKAFTDGIVFKTSGVNQSIIVEDLVNVPAVSEMLSGIQVSHIAMDHFHIVIAADPVPAGQLTDAVVTTHDIYHNPVFDYAGTIHFTSTDPNPDLPGDYTFLTPHSGSQTFVNGVRFRTTGNRAVTITDTVTATLTAQDTVLVQPAAPGSLNITGLTDPFPVGTNSDFTITIYDTLGNIATNYTGEVTFVNSDPNGTVTPASYPFNGTENGTKTFANGAYFQTLGLQRITATATTQGFSGYQEVSTLPGPAHHISVTDILDPIVAGNPSAVTVKLFDIFNNIATTYAGTIHFTSTDLTAVLPLDYTFLPADSGVKT